MNAAQPFVIPSIFTAIDQLTGPMRKMQAGLEKFSSKAMGLGLQLSTLGASIVAPLALSINAAIDFEDQMAGVAKTTGLSGKELDDYGKSILDLAKTTRTSIPDIIKIAEIGGQLGVAKNELLAFTDAANKFSVALAADYSGGVEEAISQVGKIKNLFADTRDMAIADVINKTGSAINELGAVGAGTSANINDFILLIGALPDAIKPSLTNTAALGTFFEEMGIDSKIAAGGIGNFFLVANKNIGGFASQMGMSVSAANELFDLDPSKFAVKFAESLNKLSPDKLAATLQKLGIGSQETIKVIGALGSGSARLAELQKVANNAFAEGTSLQNEYNKMNETTAAKLQRAKNTFNALSIDIGAKLMPALNKLLEKAMPILDAIANWISENPQLATTILTVVGAIGGLAAVLGPVLIVISALSSPIALVVAGIAALAIVVAEIIRNWDSWGETVAAFLGPFGMIITLVQEFRKNWDAVAKIFSEQGILEGIKAIGRTILSALLSPLQKILEVASYLPGVGDWAEAGANSIARYRDQLYEDNITTAGFSVRDYKLAQAGVPNYSFQGKKHEYSMLPAINPKLEQQQAMVQRTELSNTTTNKLEVEIKDETGRARVAKAPAGIMPKLTTTTGFNQPKDAR